MAAGPEKGAPRGWVLYDGGCGVCTHWVPAWGPTLMGLGLDVARLQDPWVAARLGLAPGDAELQRDILVLYQDGRQARGADAYRDVMRQLWWAYPLYLLATAPGLRRVFDRAYRAFADRRLLISHACGLRPPGPSPPR